MSPAGRPAQALANGCGLALEQCHVPAVACDLRLDPCHPAARMVLEVHSPFACKCIDVERSTCAFMSDQFGNVEPDAPGTHDRDLLANLSPAGDDVDIPHDLRMIDTGDFGRARRDACRNYHVIEALSDKPVSINPRAQPKRDAAHADHAHKVTKGFVKFFLAGNALGKVELAANFFGRFEQGHPVPAFGRDGCKGQTRWSCTHDRNVLNCDSWRDCDLRLPTGAGIDEAACQLAGECMVQAGLVAGDAGVDLILAALARLVDQIRVRKHRPCHRDDVCIAPRQHLFGDLRHVDAIARDHRDRQFLAQPPGHAGKGCTRDHGGDGRDKALMPAEMGGDHVDALRLEGLGKAHDLVPRHATLEHVHCRNPEHENEVWTDGLANSADDFHGEAHPVLPRAAPSVCALVGLFHEEGRNEIASGSYDLHPVIAGILGQPRAIGECSNLLCDPVFTQFIGNMPSDPRLDRRWRHTIGGTGKRPRVKDLHDDLHVSVGSMHRLRNLSMHRDICRIDQFGSESGSGMRTDPAGDDHANAALRTLCKIGREAIAGIRQILKPGMHRAHQDPVLDLCVANLKWREDVRVFGVRSHASAF